MLTQAYTEGVSSAVSKYAARAGLRQVRNLMRGGNVEAASALAKTPGVLKATPAGSSLQHLGQGSEGLATLVAHPEHGIAVRKLYDPKGLSSPAGIARKETAGRSVNDPSVARFLGSAPTPKGNATMHFNEYVNPKGPHQEPTGAAQRQAQRATKAQTIRAVRRGGFHNAQDVRADNMMWDGTAGRYKTIDYIPSMHGEFSHLSPNRQNVLVPGEGFREMAQPQPENALSYKSPAKPFMTPRSQRENNPNLLTATISGPVGRPLTKPKTMAFGTPNAGGSPAAAVLPTPTQTPTRALRSPVPRSSPLPEWDFSDL